MQNCVFGCVVFSVVLSSVSSLLFETDEISFTTNLAGRRSKQLVGNVRALAGHAEMFISLNW